jgi:V/A-type H+-transporting ATPase subunit E
VSEYKKWFKMTLKEGLLAITNEVLADVQKEAEGIILSAETAAKQTLNEAKQQADKNFSIIIEQASTKAEGEKRKIASVTEVEMRNRLLQAKEELVDAAFAKVLTKLKDFVTTAEYQRYLLKLVEKVVKDIGQKDLVIQINARDQTWLTQDVLDRQSKKLRGQIKISDQVEDFIGGFKIQTADGKMTYDSTIDNKLKELKPVLRVEMAKIMFGKGA